MKHWVKGGYYYYHNLETQQGGWDEPPDFVQNSMQLSREEIQVGQKKWGVLFVFLIFIHCDFLFERQLWGVGEQSFNCWFTP